MHNVDRDSPIFREHIDLPIVKGILKTFVYTMPAFSRIVALDSPTPLGTIHKEGATGVAKVIGAISADVGSLAWAASGFLESGSLFEPIGRKALYNAGANAAMDIAPAIPTLAKGVMNRMTSMSARK